MVAPTEWEIASLPETEALHGQKTIFSSCCWQSRRLIQECQWLENKLDCHGMTDLILTENGDQCAFKKQILEADWKASLNEAAKHQSTALAATIANRITWPKLWDMALHYNNAIVILTIPFVICKV